LEFQGLAGKCLVQKILKTLKSRKKARYVHFEAYDTYTTNHPLKELMGDDVILTHRLNDEPLPQSLGDLWGLLHS
jgi:DMSO/TMAO reductase YedYZ molybdopterin-dependent catalytic subunit